MSRALVLVAALVGGCLETTSAGGDDDDVIAAGDAGAEGDPDVLAGAFQVRLVAPVDENAGSTTVFGKVFDGATPEAIVWEVAQEEGACLLETPRVPYCAEPCGGSAVCVEDDTCAPYPASHEVGTVRLEGVRTIDGATGFSMEPIANGYQPPADVDLPFPAFGEGQHIVLDADGGTFTGPFEIAATGIAPLVLADETPVLRAGQDLVVSWAPGAAGDVHVQLDVSHHGGTRGRVQCDAADTGTLAIPAALVDGLTTLGVSGYPSVIVTRRTVGSVVLAPGRVDLVVASAVDRQVEIPGLVSCTQDEQCPDAQTCDTDLVCRP